MRPTYLEALADFTMTADEYTAELLIDLAASRTADGVCPMAFDRTHEAFKKLNEITDGIINLDKLKAMVSSTPAPQDDAGSITFGRTRR